MSRGGPRLHTAAVHPFDEVNGNEPFVSTRLDNEIDLQTATFRFSILDPHMSEATTCMTPGAVYRLYGCCIRRPHREHVALQTFAVSVIISKTVNF